MRGLESREFASWACAISYSLPAALFIAMYIFIFWTGEALNDKNFVFVTLSVIGICAMFLAAAIWLRYPWHLAMKWYASNGRLFLLVLKTLCTFALLYAVMFAFVEFGERLFDHLAETDVDLIYGWYGVLLNSGFISLFIPLYFFFFFFFVVYGSMLVLCILWGGIYTFRFVLRRVVVHPKGPVLGLAGLLVALGAVAKAFNS